MRSPAGGKPELKLVHLQLTRRCNLRCSFCGQWGERGYEKQAAGRRELETADWLTVIDHIGDLARREGWRPQFSVWGGEPLLYEGCAAILNHLKAKGFETAMVTNGVLLADHATLAASTLRTVYVSIDGFKDDHEAIRGVEGCYDKTLAGVRRLAEQATPPRVVALCTINHKNYSYLPELAKSLEPRGFSKIIFQNMIFMRPEEAARYKTWLRDAFGCDASHADSWSVEDFGPHVAELPAALARLEQAVRSGAFAVEVVMYPDEVNSSTILDYYRGPAVCPERNCVGPSHHLNISPNGDIHFCVDHNDFVLGNAARDDIGELFAGPLAERFRAEVAAGNCPACARCPWRFNDSYTLD